MKIGFIGLGIMGKPMAKNLMKAGHELVVYDVIAANVDNVVAAGAQAGASSKDVAEQCSFIITMLPNSPHVKTVVMGENGVLEGAQAGTVLVDMSSIAPPGIPGDRRRLWRKGREDAGRPRVRRRAQGH